MCCSVSASFLVFSLITLISMFTLTMLNMIFSCVTPKQYESFIITPHSASAYSNLNILSSSDDLKKENSYNKTPENIMLLREKKYWITLIEVYKSEEIAKFNDDVQKNKYVLMAFGIVSFSVIGGFIMFFVPLYSSFNCGTNCSQQCDCNCDCYLCIGVTPIKRIILFYSTCFPTIFFSFISFFITLAKKVTYSNISSKKDIKHYQNGEENFFGDRYEYYFEDSIFYNNAQFIIYLIILFILILYPLLVWLTSSEEEMNPPIVPYQKKVRYYKNTELSVDVDDNSYSYNSSPPQPQPQYIPPPPQPHYRPPPPQPHYRPPPPQPHYRPPPPPPHHHHPPPPHVGIGLNIGIPRIHRPEIVFSIH